MNLLKRFIRGNDPIDDPIDDVEGDDIYERPYDPDTDADPDVAKGIAAVDSDVRKQTQIRPASSEKVSLKIMAPRSNADAAAIADLLKEGCIVLLDISNLDKDQAYRLVDFLAGVAYVIGGEMTKTNRNTIVISPTGVDIAG
ncbi:MAG: cell division protein SepF, partial [Clostridia bacterium]|nr:cell division protein SepF [Clostridia bacterium]